MDSQLPLDTSSNNQPIINTTNTPFPPLEQPMNYWSQLGIFLGLTGGGLLIGSLLAVLIFVGMTNASVLNIEKELFNPKHLSALRLLQVVSTLFTFFLPAFLFALIVHKQPAAFLGFNKKYSVKQLLIVVAIAFSGVFAGSFLAEINEWIPISKNLAATFKAAEEKYSQQVLLLAKMNNFTDYLLSLFIIALLPAIVEELFFRGAMQQFLASWFNNPIIAIIVTSIIFSAIHMSYYGFLTRAGLGIILGLVFYYSKNIWLPIVIHFVNNGIAVTALYVYSIKGKPLKEVLDEKYPIGLGIASLVGVVALLILFKKQTAAEQSAVD